MTAEAQKWHGLKMAELVITDMTNRKKFPPIFDSDALSNLVGPSNFDSNFTREISS